MTKKTRKAGVAPPDDWEPPWLDPANDRHTPYTEEELERFAEGFIATMRDTEALQRLIEEEGLDKAKETVKEAFRKRDENNLINIVFQGSVH